MASGGIEGFVQGKKPVKPNSKILKKYCKKDGGSLWSSERVDIGPEQNSYRYITTYNSPRGSTYLGLGVSASRTFARDTSAGHVLAMLQKKRVRPNTGDGEEAENGEVENDEASSSSDETIISNGSIGAVRGQTLEEAEATSLMKMSFDNLYSEELAERFKTVKAWRGPKIDMLRGVVWNRGRLEGIRYPLMTLREITEEQGLKLCVLLTEIDSKYEVKPADVYTSLLEVSLKDATGGGPLLSSWGRGASSSAAMSDAATRMLSMILSLIKADKYTTFSAAPQPEQSQSEQPQPSV